MRQLYDNSDINCFTTELGTIFFKDDAVGPPTFLTEMDMRLTERNLYSRLQCLYRAASGSFRRLRMYLLQYLCALQPQHYSFAFAASRSMRPVATITRPSPRPPTRDISYWQQKAFSNCIF